MMRLTRLCAVAAALTVLAATGMAAAAGGDEAYKLQPGPFPVRTIKLLVLDDAARTKQLQLRVNYPDGKRIGVGGHSFGANTAQLVGGAAAFLPGGARSFEDKRVSAVMLLSGQGPGEMLTEKSWAHFARPMLVMTGSRDGPTRTGQPAEWRKKPYELSPPGDKYLVWVDGLDHGYGGITGVNFNPRNKPNPDHVAWTKIVTRAFWDAYLKQSQEARAYLESGKLDAFSKETLKITHK